MPSMTVVIDTYNHERFIAAAIQSVLEQDFPHEQMEILVVDDGSTDGTPEIVRKFEPHVRLLRKQNGGQASAINFGIQQASGEIIAFLDGDDLWLPNKLSRVIQEFEKDPRVVMVYHRSSFFDMSDGSTWEPPLADVSGDVLGDRSKLRLYRGAATSSLAFRRAVLLRLAPVPVQCSFMHDIYLVSCVICIGNVAAIAESLTRYRVHGQNLCFAEKGRVDPELLRRRARTWSIAADSIEAWTRANAPLRSRLRMRILTRRWRVARDADEARTETPGRFRYFMSRCRFNLAYGWNTPLAEITYNWVHTFFELVVGREHSHYLEGVRTRIRRLANYFLQRRSPAPDRGKQPL
jgi:hypothetical protein